MTTVHPFFLEAKSEASKVIYPNWHQAMNGPFEDEYWKAAEKEMDGLEGMGAWDVVECKNDKKGINGTWAFKCKQFPNGTVKKFKACFCACEDQQLKRIDFFKTYAPVVQLTTFCLMLFFDNILDLKSKQADITAALGKMKNSMWRCFLVSSSMTKLEVHGSLSQENSLWLASKSLCVLEIPH